jgi:hypothetical protein
VGKSGTETYPGISRLYVIKGDVMSKTLKKTEVYQRYIFGEMSKNKKYSLEDLKHFVDSLSMSQSKSLCKYWSVFRKNSVYDFIKSGSDNWKVGLIEISNIYVEKVNDGVNTLLEKNEWSLAKIVEDSEIGVHDEFKSQGEIGNRLLGFIAKKVEDKYTIIDGIHRAIRLGLDGKKEFTLIYY